MKLPETELVTSRNVSTSHLIWEGVFWRILGACNEFTKKLQLEQKQL